MKITKKELASMDKLYRAAFINSIGGYRSTVLIGTKSKDGIENLAIFSSLVHLGSNPALYGFVMRPASVERHTLENIRSTQEYTVNHINKSIYKQAHQTPAKYKRSVSEFEAVGLNAEYASDFSAPFVVASKIRMAMQLEDEIPIRSNGTILIVGRVKFVLIPDDILQKDGFVDIMKVGSLTTTGLDAYYEPNARLGRLAFARPDQ